MTYLLLCFYALCLMEEHRRGWESEGGKSCLNARMVVNVAQRHDDARARGLRGREARGEADA